MSLRLLRIVRTLDRAAGGPVEGIRQQSPRFRDLGHRTTIVAFDPPEAIEPVEGAEVVGLGGGLGTYGFRRGAIGQLRALADDHDVAIIHGLWQYHGFAARCAFADRLPYLLYPHGMLDPWFNTAYPLKTLKKRLYWRLCEQRTVRDAARVCFTTESERLLARTSFSPYAAREAVVGYGTADPPPTSPGQRAAFLAACPQAAGRPYLLFLSRLHPKKGCDLLIAAFAAIAGSRPDLLLVIAGPDSGGWQARLADQAARAGIADRIAWPGMLQGEAKWGAFHGAEAFCLPSHQENFGIAVAEALACGKPVLISDQVNIQREIVSDGAGLVAPDTAVGTLSLVRGWLGLSQAARVAMGAAARACFTSRFEIGRAMDSHLALLHEIVAGHQPDPRSPPR